MTYDRGNFFIFISFLECPNGHPYFIGDVSLLCSYFSYYI